MSDKAHQAHRSLSSTLAIVFLIIALLLIASFFVLNYASAREEISSQFEDTMDTTIQTMHEEIALVDRGLALYERADDAKLARFFEPFLAAYQEAGGDIAAINLTLLRSGFALNPGEVTELYIINESGVVVASTYEPDIGLDFSAFPEFYDSLTAIREGDAFVSDRVTDSMGENQHSMQYAYLPTPDHRYLLEIGHYSDTVLKAENEFSFTAVTESLTERFPDVVSATFYDRAYRDPWGTITDDPALIGTLSRIFEDTQEVEVVDETNATVTRFFHMVITEDTRPSSPYLDQVGVIVFSTRYLEQTLNIILFTNLLSALITGGLAVLLIWYLSRYLTHSVRSLAGDLDMIAGGDLEHAIGRTATSETENIRAVTETLVTRLKGEMAELQKKSAALDLELKERIAVEEELENANKKLALLSGITRHDLLNQMAALVIYLDILEQTLAPDGNDHGLFRQIDAIVETIETLIEFSREYEDLGSISPSWQDVGGMAQAIAAGPEFRGIRLRNETAGLEIRSDPLLQKVLYNLFDNALRHGERVSEITMQFSDAGGPGVLTIADNGAGIPAGEKESVFGRGVGKNTGFGLFLSREVLSLAGITIRETGKPGDGARFELTLPEGSWRIRKGKDSRSHLTGKSPDSSADSPQ